MRTVVTREPEWDDQQRDRMVALEIYEAGVGPCGFHHSLTNDLSNGFTFEVERCNVCAASALEARRQAAEDRKALDRFGKDGPPPTEPFPADGRRTMVRMMHPLEVAEAKAKRVTAIGSRVSLPNRPRDGGDREPAANANRKQR